jgi:hypothetical protein
MAPGRPAQVALGGGQAQARARVGALRQCAVRGRGGLADLGARAPALVQQAGGRQPLERRLVERRALGLPDDGAVPVQAQHAQVGQLLVLEAPSHPAGVEVLHAHPEAPSLAAREQPGQQGGPQVAHV